MESKGWKNKKTSTIVGTETNPTKLESGQVVINKKATKQNLDRLIEINNDGLDKPIKKEVTTDGTEGGLLKGKAHYDENGNPLGGIPAVVDGAKKIETENDEFLLNKEASQKHWKELSKINQSTGNGVPINPSDVGADEDPKEFKDGGVIEFNPNKIPSRAIYAFAKKVKQKYPKVWDMGGNIFGNEAFNNLERVIKRGYWTESEEWMYIKWRSYVARHHKDFRIAGTIAMLKWVDKTDKGWPYMKALIEKEIAKKYPKKGWKNKMAEGGGVGEYSYTEKDMDDFTNLLEQEIEKSGYITRVSKSKTNFGKSNYVFATNKEDDLYTPNEIKIRISDHSVSNYDRIFNEYHIVFPIEKKDYNQITEGVLKHIKYYFDRDKYFYSKEVNVDKKSYNVTTETPFINSDEITKEWVTKKGKKMYEVTRTFTNKATQWIDKKTNKVYTTIENKMKTGGGVEFIPEKKGTLIRGNEIIKYFEKVNGNYRLIFYTLNETKVPTMCDAFGYCKELDNENLTPKQLAELIKKNNLMEHGGGVKDITCKSCNWSWNKSDSEKHDEYVCHKCGADNKMENAEDFMRWYIDWNKTINKKINISFSLPNIIQPFKESNVVILDLFEKIDQKIDAKQYLNKIIENADKYGVVIYLEPIPRYKYFLKNIEKRKKISKDYLISYYQKFGFQLTTNGRFMKRLPKPRTDNKKKYGGELAKGIKSEQEHIDTAKKLYEHKINPSEAARSIAQEHLKEHPKYYSAMENIDFDKHYDEIKTKYADGGSVEATYTLNTPSGEKSKLTYLQQVLVRTSVFKKFFGDWEGAAKRYLADNKENFKKHFENISKVMDMSILEPRVVYHGTRTEEQFFMFDVSKEKGVGRPYAYFAYNKEYSENFINFSQRSHSNSQPFLYDCFLNIRNPFWALGHAYEMKKKNHDYWINSIVGTIAIDKYDTVEKNAKTKKLEDAVKSQIEEYLIQSAGNTNVSFWSFMARDTNSDFKYFLIAYGYDGIFYDEEFASDYDPENPKEYTRAVTVFTANDIKLADGKNLNFDPMNADIRFEQGGVPEQQAPIEHSLTKKEKLGNLLFGDKFARGGTANKEQSDVIYKEELPTNNRKFVDELIKKMKE